MDSFQTEQSPIIHTSSELTQQPPEVPPSPLLEDPEIVIAKPKKKSVIVPILLGLLALVGIAALSFWIGQHSQKSNVVVVAPTSSPQTTDAPLPTPVPTMEPSLAPLPVVTTQPVRKVNSTPTPVPTPSPSPTPKPQTTVTITQVAGQDGYVSSDGQEINSNDGIDVGVRQSPDKFYHGFVGFDISSIPKTATIISARLNLYQFAVIANPYATQGSIVVDHVDYGTTLGADDYNTYAIDSNIGTLSIDPSIGWKHVDATNSVRWDLSHHVSSQFMLRFTTPVSVPDALAAFDAAVSSQSQTQFPTNAQLVITYTN